MAQEPWLIVGLGNPGPQYAANRHNAGFMVVDVLAARMGGRFKAHKHRADVVEGRLGGTRAILIKPKTYMNESGGPVAALRSFFGVPMEQVIVVHDELDLEAGVVRVKLGGGDNGHNGLRSVTKSLGSKEYLRVRLGVGRPPGQQDPADYVLRDVPAASARRRSGYRSTWPRTPSKVWSVEGLEAYPDDFHQSPDSSRR